MKTRLCLLLLCAVVAGAVAADEKPLGQSAPEWQLTNWLHSAPLTVKELQGKVVLVRWWTAPQCPYCRATAPALNEFHSAYHDKGLRVIGVYHHKAATPLDLKAVKEFATQFGFQFPVAIDPEWKNLRRWWLDHDDRRWTSVSFLLDRHGIIRHLHPGGQYVKGDPDYATMKAKIEELLAEK